MATAFMLEYKTGDPTMMSGHIIVISGHRYTVEVIQSSREVILWSLPDESPASSLVQLDSYSYTHGGGTYCAAVDQARSLAASLGY